MELKAGKRYWFIVNKVGENGSGYFRSRSRARSGLYGGEHDPHNGNAIIHEKNGSVWSIPRENLYLSESEANRACRKGKR